MLRVGAPNTVPWPLMVAGVVSSAPNSPARNRRRCHKGEQSNQAARSYDCSVFRPTGAPRHESKTANPDPVTLNQNSDRLNAYSSYLVRITWLRSLEYTCDGWTPRPITS